MTRYAKQVADLITWVRSVLIVIFPWLGYSQGKSAMPAVMLLVMTNWTLDSLDGPLARRGRQDKKSWIGDHDLEIDVAITVGLLAYMVAAGWLPWAAAGAYLVASLAILWWVNFHSEAYKLFQGPIYIIFLITAFQQYPETARWLVVWMLAATIVTWPKLPRVIVPTILGGIRELWADHRPGAGTSST